MRMFQEITYYQIFGKPLMMYLGILTLTAFLATAAIGYMALKGKVPLVWHMRMGMISLVLGIVHGTMGLLAYL